MYETHIEVTTKFYRSELEKDIKLITEEYEREQVPVEENYKAVYAATGGSKEERHLIAEQASGKDAMYENYQYLQELCEKESDEKFDYFNKSSMIMLYSMIESEMKRLCTILKEFSEVRISIDDFKSMNYMKGYFKYLDLVINLPFVGLEKFNTKIESIQYVRNRIVHSNSEVGMTGDNEEKKALQNAIDNSNNLLKQVYDPQTSRTYLRIFDSRYVTEGYQLLKDLVRELFYLINRHFEYPLLKVKLMELFKKSYDDAVFSVLEASEIARGIKFKLKVTSNNEMDVPDKFMMNIVITKGKEDCIEILDQIGDNQKIQQLCEHIKQKKYLASRYFMGWVRPAPKLKIQFTFF
jgi:hypothetical protein